MRCNLLVNPFTGRKLVEQKADELGSIWLEERDGKKYLVWYFFQPPDFAEPAKLPVELPVGTYTAKEREIWKNAEPTLKGAMALEDMLYTVFQGFGQCARDLGWEGFLQRFPGMKALRNPFSGAALQAALWETKSIDRAILRQLIRAANPGEFVVVFPQSGPPTVHIVMGDGRLLLEVLEELRRKTWIPALP